MSGPQRKYLTRHGTLAIGSALPLDEAIELGKRKLRDLSPVNENGCWVWSGWKTNLGYGEMGWRNQSWRTHRLSYRLFKGEFDPKMDVCHSCDNRSCVNPDHLWLGTHMDNMLDHIKKGRHYEKEQTHCWRGHPFSGDNLYLKPGGGRACKECGRIRNRPGYVRRASRKISQAIS